MAVSILGILMALVCAIAQSSVAWKLIDGTRAHAAVGAESPARAA
jgi:hypothetical protein